MENDEGYVWIRVATSPESALAKSQYNIMTEAIAQQQLQHMDHTVQELRLELREHRIKLEEKEKYIKDLEQLRRDQDIILRQEMSELQDMIKKLTEENETLRINKYNKWYPYDSEHEHNMHKILKGIKRYREQRLDQSQNFFPKC